VIYHGKEDSSLRSLKGYPGRRDLRRRKDALLSAPNKKQTDFNVSREAGLWNGVEKCRKKRLKKRIRARDRRIVKPRKYQASEKGPADHSREAVMRQTGGGGRGEGNL